MSIFINRYHSIIIGIVAGETSGDILGAGLMQSLKKHLGGKVFFCGIGGPRMQLEKMESWYKMTELSIMGIIEVIPKLPKILSIRRQLIYRFLNLKIDIFIGIDFPDFNISLERYLKKKGICTIHYVSPSIWAWRKKRIIKIKQSVDKILLLFPFEKKIYEHFRIPCQFVGHTLADQIPINPNKTYFRKKLGISEKKYCIALLPGSRIREIKLLTYDFLQCTKLLMRHFPNVEVLVPLANQESVKQFKCIASKFTKVRIFNHKKAWQIMVAADAAVLTSGTATLECMLAKCPMVVAYRMNFLTFLLVKYLINVAWISWPNLLSNENLVQEFIQNKCRPEILAEKLIVLLNNRDQCFVLKKKFRQLHHIIKRNANNKAAYAIIRSLKLHSLKESFIN